MRNPWPGRKEKIGVSLSFEGWDAFFDFVPVRVLSWFAF
jgi:hypothetical protein